MPRARIVDSKPPFPGFRSPTYTIVPDELFDDLLADLTGAELKVLLYIIRRTFGFKKTSDNISLRQLVEGITTSTGHVIDHGTGLSKDSVARAVKSLEEQHIVVREHRHSRRNGDEATTYALNLQHPVSENQTPPGPKIRHPVYQKSDSQETVTQDTDISNTRMLDADEKMPPRQAGKMTPTDRSRSSTRWFEPVSDTLRRTAALSAQADDRRHIIRTLLRELRQEFGDRASLPSSTSRTLNLWRRSHLDTSIFTSRVYEARAVTKDSIRSARTPIKNQMAFFFRVLEDVLGLATTSEEAAPTS